METCHPPPPPPSPPPGGRPPCGSGRCPARRGTRRRGRVVLRARTLWSIRRASPPARQRLQAKRSSVVRNFSSLLLVFFARRRPLPPPPSRLTAQLRHRRLHLLFSFPFVPNPQSHSPFPLTKHHIAKTKRALAPFPQTIPLCLSSVEEHVECWIFRIQHNFVRRCCENAGMYDVFCVWCV